MSTDTLTMTHAGSSSGESTRVVLGILAALIAYVVALLAGVPQQLTEAVANASHGEHHAAEAHADASHADGAHPMGSHASAAGSDAHAGDHASGRGASHADGQAGAQGGATGHAEAHGSGAGHAAAAAPPVWTVIPFVLLLGSIAVLPLIPATEHWWESNTNRFKVAAGLGLVTLAYYGFVHETPVEGHFPAHYTAEAEGGLFEVGFVRAILGNAILSEFVPFIVLLFSLYTISGGIRIEGDLQATPTTNASFMAAGGLLASFIGTTGAAMLLIRPLLETNAERKRVVHTVVFFIFIVCNCGGCLLPIGDPPLFLGYLHGVDFFWTLGLWSPWLLCNGLLLGFYLLVDNFYHYPKETIRDRERDIERVRSLEFSGLAVNAPLLLGVVAAVALLDPSKVVPGSEWLLGYEWHAWMYFREVVQLSLVAISLAFGAAWVREKNGFNYHAIVEVAALFCGIFVCMQPALQILGVYGDQLGVDSPTMFFWITGGLSSVLDNAPTYLVFFETAKSLPVDANATMVSGTGVSESVLVAISLGAVFMGAMTYIGNGPNFMVKAIAEQSGVRMPSFFGYMGYSCVCLLPVLVIVAFRHVG
ncbi:MAG: sodium:proton antiporter [Planctomycetota bacterium]